MIKIFFKNLENLIKKERNQILHSLKIKIMIKIYKELGIIFWIIKDKKMQDKVFNILYNSYIENNEDINILLLNNNDFCNEFKTEFINNVHNNKFDFNLSA